MSHDSGAARAQPWVLVADHARARFFTAATPSAPLQESTDLVNPDARLREHELDSDSPGHLFGGRRGAGAGGHAAAVRGETKKDHAAAAFAKRVGEHLAHARAAGAFGRLYVIAEPDFLGLLRQHLDDPTRHLVVLELHKDLTHSTADAIRQALPKAL